MSLGRVSTLVTGAYGMLGSWLVKALLEQGEDVVILRRAPRPQSRLVLEGLEPRCTVVEGDLLDEGLPDRLIAGQRVGTVFHLAAQAIVAHSEKRPSQTFETNVRGTWLLLEACRRHDVASVVAASSALVAAGTPYDASKAAVDLIARSYWTTYGLPVATTRFTNIYGGGDGHRSRLVPDAIAAALSGRDPVVRSDGTPRRDFLHVEDAATAYLAIAGALGRADDRASGAAFDGGTGRSYAVREVVDLVCRLVGGGVRPDVRGESTPGELRDQKVDASKLREVTGWVPRVDLEQGLRRTIAWYREHPSALGS